MTETRTSHYQRAKLAEQDLPRFRMLNEAGPAGAWVVPITYPVGTRCTVLDHDGEEWYATVVVSDPAQSFVRFD